MKKQKQYSLIGAAGLLLLFLIWLAPYAYRFTRAAREHYTFSSWDSFSNAIMYFKWSPRQAWQRTKAFACSPRITEDAESGLSVEVSPGQDILTVRRDGTYLHSFGNDFIWQDGNIGFHIRDVSIANNTVHWRYGRTNLMQWSSSGETGEKPEQDL